MATPFLLLMLAVAAVWLPSVRVGSGWSISPWGVVYAAATGLAVAQGFVAPVGVAALVLLIGLAELLRRQTLLGGLGGLGCPARPSRYWLVFACLLVLAVALSLHAVPGFRNPVALDAVKFSEDGRPFTQYLNFDKGSVGLVLVALLAPRFRRGDGVLKPLAMTLLLTLIVAGAALGLAAALGMIRWDPKWPPQALQFLMTNLLLTCVAEEALFRVMVQERLAASPSTGLPHGWGWRPVVALVITAVLFGAAHAGAGIGMIAVATLAGAGYAFVYQWQRRIEASVLLHFGVNALHFVLFTYPLKA